jgi:hypothetical protein
MLFLFFLLATCAAHVMTIEGDNKNEKSICLDILYCDLCSGDHYYIYESRNHNNLRSRIFNN